jgi:hypothetical protein
MNINHDARGRAFLFASVALALPAALLGFSCKGPSLSSGSEGAPDLVLAFRVLGAPARVDLSRSSVSPLLLPTAASLSLSLEPLDAGLSRPQPQEVPIASASGAQTVTATIPGVEKGRYTLSAVASSAAGDPLFRRSSTLVVGTGDSSATIDLLPVIDGSSPVHDGVGFTVGTIAPGAAVACEVPESAMYNGSYDINNFTLTMNSADSLDFFVQDADGSLITSGTIDYMGYITSKEGSAMPSLTISPPSASVSYLVLYNATSSAVTGVYAYAYGAY